MNTVYYILNTVFKQTFNNQTKMKKKMNKHLIIIAVLCGDMVSNSFAVKIDKSNYKIALSFDGNAHDKDDILALPMSLALIAEGGVKSKFIHMDYSNHIWNNDGNQNQLMNQSVSGACKNWGIPKSKCINAKDNLNGAKNNFKNAVNSAGKARVYYACGGPMEVPYQCVMTLTKAKRGQVTVISHSAWNNKHKHGKSHTWKQLITTGVKNISIGDQNKTAFNQPTKDWTWLKNKGGKYAWLYSRNKKKSFDASDAGIVWFIITGRGDKKATMTNVKSFFTRKSSEEKVVESVESFNVNVYPNPAVDNVNVVFEGTAPVTVFNIQGKVVYQNNEATDGIELNKDMIGESGVYFIKVKDVTKQLIIK